ncbi:hypothetical protein QJS10_CPB12g00599 [Acorus calamus]|uniref:Ribosome maturation factor RimM n=1 Tax=Acorus calamus TaxID=4465 RepID=A0AAV9DM01_ACOCL|nr:hypothetical protein QJS10_CPB12g00599 [Acorus calamus]
MQPTSLLTHPTQFTVSPHRLQWHSPGFRTKIPLRPYPRRVPSLLCTANTDVGLTLEEFIEIGFISSVHGLDGELRVKATTDFPEMRFSVPGKRWLKTRVAGEETVREVELLEGRGHPGQKSWILSFGGVNSVDEARQIVGSTLLVKGADRPELEEGEFYIPDLVGMKVFLKETGEPVGTVVDVYNSGASDLLQVMLAASNERVDGSGVVKPEAGISGPLVWVPFVEEIVPHVDMDKREMLISPPKGLLELNVRLNGTSRERRQLERKQRKKSQQRLLAAKKKLSELGQKHILQGLSFGEKAQKEFLVEQIININLKLFQHATQSVDMPNSRFHLPEFVDGNSTTLLKNALKISHESFILYGKRDKQDKNFELRGRGLHLLSERKAAIILVVDNKNSERIDLDGFGKAMSNIFLQELLGFKRFAEVEEQQASVPLVVICPAGEIKPYQLIFSESICSCFDSQKVWFLEEEKLPVVSILNMNQGAHKILLKSPWEILQSPVGSGGVFSLLSSHNILDGLKDMGVEYVQVCNLSKRSFIGHPLLFGLVSTREADIGIQIFDGHDERDFNIVLSMKYLKKLTNENLIFNAVLKQDSHVEQVDGEWRDIQPESPNSYHFSSSIYSSLDSCPPSNICVMQVVD